MSRLTEKQLLFLTIGITVLLTGGLGFLIWSDLKTIDQEEATIAKLEAGIKDHEKEIALRPQREYQVIADREVAEREVAFLPEADEIEHFWEVLEHFANESGVRISEITPTELRNSRRKGPQGPIASVPQVMSLRGTIDEFLRFVNLIENYDRIINVVEYQVRRGETEDPDGVIRHSIRLALTTFTYSKKIAETIVSIQKYEEKKSHAEVKKWLSRIKIQEKETYTLANALGRRDPFVSIRVAKKVVTDVDDKAEEERQNQIVDQLVIAVRALSEGLDYEEMLRKRGDLWRLQQQRKENRENFALLMQMIKEAEKEITNPRVMERFQAEVLEPWKQLQERVNLFKESEPAYTAEQVNEVLKKVKMRFDERQWIDVQKEVNQFLHDSRKGEHVVDDARPMVQELLDLQNRARVIQDFEKKKVEISTILYSESNPANSVAVINGKQMGEGDVLDPAGTIIVLSIGQNYVIFLTEDVEIKRFQK